MPEPKSNCVQCGAEILQTTAQRNDGLCEPCKQRLDRCRRSREPVEVSCSVGSDVGTEPLFFTSAQDLLEALEKTRRCSVMDWWRRRCIKDSAQVTKLALEAQRALLRYAIRYRVNIRLNDDHWGGTGAVLLKLFEQGKATMQIGSKTFHISELSKEDWSEVLVGGGFLYRDSAGVVIYKRAIWVS